MNPIFQSPNYLLRRQAIALTGKFRCYDPAGRLVMFSEQKMFRLKEDIRIYGDESKTQEVLSIQARQIMDFSAAYDVVDTQMNQKVGALRRKGWSSLVRDEWEVLDASGIRSELVVYQGAPHSFFDRAFTDYARASQDAWSRVLAFIHRDPGDGLQPRPGSLP